MQALFLIFPSNLLTADFFLFKSCLSDDNDSRKSSPLFLKRCYPSRIKIELIGIDPTSQNQNQS